MVTRVGSSLLTSGGAHIGGSIYTLGALF